MVIDQVTNEVYGHVVACGPVGQAYIVPITSVFRQIRACFSTTYVRLFTIASNRKLKLDTTIETKKMKTPFTMMWVLDSDDSIVSSPPISQLHEPRPKTLGFGQREKIVRPGSSSFLVFPEANPRRHVYFLPEDGIHRDVIATDICRYLDDVALIAPGTYQDPRNGGCLKGYHIAAYRTLTSAMIKNLKEDSATWGLISARQRIRSGFADFGYAVYGKPVVYPGNVAPGYSGNKTPSASSHMYPGSGSVGSSYSGTTKVTGYPRGYAL